MLLKLQKLLLLLILLLGSPLISAVIPNSSIRLSAYPLISLRRLVSQNPHKSDHSSFSQSRSLLLQIWEHYYLAPHPKLRPSQLPPARDKRQFTAGPEIVAVTGGLNRVKYCFRHIGPAQLLMALGERTRADRGVRADPTDSPRDPEGRNQCSVRCFDLNSWIIPSRTLSACRCDAAIRRSTSFSAVVVSRVFSRFTRGHRSIGFREDRVVGKFRRVQITRFGRYSRKNCVNSLFPFE